MHIEKAELKAEAVDLPVDFHFYPYLWSQALVSEKERDSNCI